MFFNNKYKKFLCIYEKVKKGESDYNLLLNYLDDKRCLNYLNKNYLFVEDYNFYLETASIAPKSLFYNTKFLVLYSEKLVSENIYNNIVLEVAIEIFNIESLILLINNKYYKDKMIEYNLGSKIVSKLENNMKLDLLNFLVFYEEKVNINYSNNIKLYNLYDIILVNNNKLRSKIFILNLSNEFIEYCMLKIPKTVASYVKSNKYIEYNSLEITDILLNINNNNIESNFTKNYYFNELNLVKPNRIDYLNIYIKLNNHSENFLYFCFKCDKANFFYYFKKFNISKFFLEKIKDEIC